MSVITEVGTQGVAASSDATTRVLEELQFTVGEGPCRDARATRRPVLVPDLSGTTGTTRAAGAGAGADAGAGAEQPASAVDRWPGYVPAVRERGVRAVFASPPQVGAGRLGVLDVHRDTSGESSQEALARALAFAEVAVTALLEGRASAGSGRAPEGLEEVFRDRLAVHRAQGMVMVQLGVSIGEAMVRLRAHAYATDRRIEDVASDVIARRLVLEQDTR